MSDRIKYSPDSARNFIMNHPRTKALGAVALSAAFAFSMPMPEGQPPLTEVKIGSHNPSIMEDLRDNGGATLRGGPSTKDAPIGRAPVGEVFNVIDIVENGSWVKVQLDPEENLPDVQINYGLLPIDTNGQLVIPTEAYIKRTLVKRAPDKLNK